MVLLTNTSASDLSTWTQDYSWGYDNLSFLIVRADGTSFHVKRKPEIFTKNGPIPYLIRPHDHFAWAVTFSPDDWTGFPSDWKGSEDVSMKAVFEINETPESTRLKVWTGIVESPSIKVNLTRFLKQWYLKRSYSND